MLLACAWYNLCMNELEYSELGKALVSYADAVLLYREHLESGESQREINTDTAAIIQNFEFTIEVSWQLIQKWLTDSGFGFESFDSKDKLFKTAYAEGLIDDAEKWYNYYRARNLSVHYYGKDVVKKIFEIALAFLDEAKGLNEKLAK